MVTLDLLHLRFALIVITMRKYSALIASLGMTTVDLYLHEVHLGQTYSAVWAWDSDWSGGACDS